jgi:hypothetical protein
MQPISHDAFRRCEEVDESIDDRSSQQAKKKLAYSSEMGLTE